MVRPAIAREGKPLPVEDGRLHDPFLAAEGGDEPLRFPGIARLQGRRAAFLQDLREDLQLLLRGDVVSPDLEGQECDQGQEQGQAYGKHDHQDQLQAEGGLLTEVHGVVRMAETLRGLPGRRAPDDWFKQSESCGEEGAPASRIQPRTRSCGSWSMLGILQIVPASMKN